MAKNPEARIKMEDHEAMAQFGFPKHGPHPEIHCDIHRYTCCICNEEQNDKHIKETTEECQPSQIESGSSQEQSSTI